MDASISLIVQETPTVLVGPARVQMAPRMRVASVLMVRRMFFITSCLKICLSALSEDGALV